MIWLWYMNGVDKMAVVHWFLEMLYIYFQYHNTNEMCVLAVYKKRGESPLSIVGGHQKYYALNS